MVEKTKNNISELYSFLFNEEFKGSFNGITWDFTDKISIGISLFDEIRTTPFSDLYNSFDYVIGNPPYVTLYGRRDKKENEEQRVNYLNNYNQFPSSVNTHWQAELQVEVYIRVSLLRVPQPSGLLCPLACY